MTFFEREHYEAVLAHLPQGMRPAVMFVYVPGSRINSEVLPIQWRPVDFRVGEGNHLDAAVALLLRLVDATEAEAAANDCRFAPWYYEQLAIIYAKTKRVAAEVSILERYAAQQKAPGVGPSVLAERLAKARLRMAAK